MQASFNQPEHWRERAAQMRALADGITDLVTKATMLDIAEQYDRLAVRAEQRLQNQRPAA